MFDHPPSHSLHKQTTLKSRTTNSLQARALQLQPYKLAHNNCLLNSHSQLLKLLSNMKLLPSKPATAAGWLHAVRMDTASRSQTAITHTHCSVPGYKYVNKFTYFTSSTNSWKTVSYMDSYASQSDFKWLQHYARNEVEYFKHAIALDLVNNEPSISRAGSAAKTWCWSTHQTAPTSDGARALKSGIFSSPMSNAFFCRMTL